MIRLFLWFLFWICTLGMSNIDVRYKDGVHIKFKGVDVKYVITAIISFVLGAVFWHNFFQNLSF